MVCRGLYGKVVVVGFPATNFEFKSKAIWINESYDKAVRKGILDELKNHGLDSNFGGRFVLQEIGWHEVDSCEVAYYEAARKATEEILFKSNLIDEFSH